MQGRKIVLFTALIIMLVSMGMAYALPLMKKVNSVWTDLNTAGWPISDPVTMLLFGIGLAGAVALLRKE